MRTAINWTPIQEEYCDTGASFAELGRKYGVKRKTIATRAARHRWKALRLAGLDNEPASEPDPHQAAPPKNPLHATADLFTQAAQAEAPESAKDSAAQGGEAPDSAEDSAAQGDKAPDSAEEFAAQGDEASDSAEEFAAQGDKTPDSAKDSAAQGDEAPDSAEEFAAQGGEAPDSAEELAAQGDKAPDSAEEFAAQGDKAPDSAEEFAAQGDEAPDSAEEFAAQGDKTPESAKDSAAQGDEAPESAKDPAAQGDEAPDSAEELSAQGDKTPDSAEEFAAQGDKAPDSAEEFAAQGDEALARAYLWEAAAHMGHVLQRIFRDEDQFFRYLVKEKGGDGTALQECICQKADTKAIRDMANVLKTLTASVRDLSGAEPAEKTPAGGVILLGAAEEGESDRELLEEETADDHEELEPE